jgi:hypothetical protein
MRSRRHTHRGAAFRILASTVAAVLCGSALANGQSADPKREPVLALGAEGRPITAEERRQWFFRGVAEPKSVGVLLATSTWQTVVDSPKEWNGASGFTKRMLANETQTGISKGIEASLGALWGEDPRRRRSGSDGVGGRLGFAVKTVILAPRPDGRLAPAWGRYAGTVGSSVVENAWLPSRLTTPRETAGRIASGFLSHLMINLWTEFGSDVRRGLTRAVGSGRKSRPPKTAVYPEVPSDQPR